MTRGRWFGLGFAVLALVVLSVLAPSEAEDRPDPAAYAQAADAAYDAGDFKFAATGYRVAFSLYDPVDPGHAERRGVLAMKRVRALVRLARQLGPDDDLGRVVGEAAERWIDEALALDPGAGWAHFERAMLLDSDWSPEQNPERALAAYRAFLAWVDAGDFQGEPNVPDPDGPLVRGARERVAALGE